MKKKLVLGISVFLLLANNLLPTNNSVVQDALPDLLPDQVQKINLEYVNFSRIEKAVKKYEHLQSKVKWVKRLKYAAIGAGCAGVVALLLNQYFETQVKVEGEEEKTASQMSGEEGAKLDMRCKVAKVKRAEEYLKSRTLGGKIKDEASDVVSFIAVSVLGAILWKIIDEGSSSFNDYFIGPDLQDSAFYKQKNERINILIQRIGFFLMQKGHPDKGEVSTKFLDLILADILIDHTALIRWFEDLVGFIKCAIILNTGPDSVELECFVKDVEVLSKKLNQFTDGLSIVINSQDVQERSNFTGLAVESYMNFCRQLSKFIYDCGLYLYEDDFLQK